MDYIFEKTLQKLGRSNTALSQKNIKKIKINFPIPKEHKILWADVKFERRLSGLVLTNIGIFLKGDLELIKQHNSKITDKEKKINDIFHYFRWEHFNHEDFAIKNNGNFYSVIFSGSTIALLSNKNKFFKIYKETYESVEAANVSASNVFADFEAVIPENFAAVNTKTGHGEMAEEALTLLDKLSGHDAKVVGRTNEKNGADRLVDGIEIQTKYCATGKKCINECFDKTTGEFRYNAKNGKPMQIEVPKDQYAEALEEFRKKISEGKVPGVTDPKDAEKYIKQGKLTYKQTLNLCKAGTIESLTYDAATGVINCSFAFGITFLVTFVTCYIQTGDRTEAGKAAFIAGIEVFGLSFLSHILTQQVARTNLTKSLIPLSEYIVKKMGYKTVQTIVNAIRKMMGKNAISGAAAMKQLAKILRNNTFTNVITFVVFSIPDTYNVFTKKVSGAQYTKNALSLVASIAGAQGGTVAASVATAKIAGTVGTAVSPGVGTAIGIAGGAIGGIVAGSVVKVAGDYIKEDDSIVTSRLFNAVVINTIYDYMLTEKEIDALIEKLNCIKGKDFKVLFKNIRASNNQEKVITDFIEKYYKDIVKSRPKVAEPTPEDIVRIIEELGKEMEEKTDSI